MGKILSDGDEKNTHTKNEKNPFLVSQFSHILFETKSHTLSKPCLGLSYHPNQIPSQATEVEVV